MRAFVVAGLVVFHSAVVFATGGSWFVTDPGPSAVFTVFLLWGSLWGMPLLFLVSGMGARYAMRTRPAAAFARERLARLGVPFVADLAALVPPMFYLERLAQPAFHQSYWRFWLGFVNVPAIAAGLLPRGSWTSGGVSFDPAHLWFLYVLVVFSVRLLPLLACLRGPRGSLLTGRLAGLAERHGGVVVWAAAIPLMVTEAVFGPDVNTGGWERATHVFPFLYGFVIACDSRFEAALLACNAAYSPSPAMSSPGGRSSAIRPRSRTSVRSAITTVDSRWATMRSVRPASTVRSASCARRSLGMSSSEVASPSTSTAGAARNARANRRAGAARPTGAAALADRRGVAPGQRGDEVMGADHRGRRLDVGVGRVGTAEPDVVRDRPFEQEVLPGGNDDLAEEHRVGQLP